MRAVKRLLQEEGFEVTSTSLCVSDKEPSKVHINVKNLKPAEMKEKMQYFAERLEDEAEERNIQLINLECMGLPIIPQSIVSVRFQKKEKEDQKQEQEAATEMKPEAKSITVETVSKKETTWADIKAAVEAGEPEKLLKVGDRIPFTTKHGKEYAVLVAHIKDGKVYFVLDDAYAKYHMKKALKDGQLLSWSESDMREYLKTTILPDLPDDMVAAISTRMIKQRIGGKDFFTEDKLWLPSYTELFGDTGDDNYPSDGEDEFRFDIFKDEKSRVRQFDGETDWWWTRTPRAGSSTGFRYVGTSGNANSSHATITNSVCFGFCVG